jgi:hypothetical protein
MPFRGLKIVHFIQVLVEFVSQGSNADPEHFGRMGPAAVGLVKGLKNKLSTTFKEVNPTVVSPCAIWIIEAAVEHSYRVQNGHTGLHDPKSVVSWLSGLGVSLPFQCVCESTCWSINVLI